MKSVLIVGATSGMAKALAHGLSRKGYQLMLAGRDQDKLNKIAEDIAIRYGHNVETALFNAEDTDTHHTLIDKATEAFGELDGLVFTVGYMPDQQEAQTHSQLAKKAIDVNFTAGVTLLNAAANYFEEKGEGFICALSSVAGDRGRKSNYIYGSAKAGLSAYLDGLRHRLANTNVTVLTVKPGFVDTKMTYGQEGLFLVASPEKVADHIIKAIHNKKRTIYTPAFWWAIMAIIKRVPFFIFKRMDL